MADIAFEEKDVEFKREFSDKIKRAIVAFANSDGGKIYVGVDDFGRAVGVADVSDVQNRVVNLARTCIKPDVTPYLDCRAENYDGKRVVVVEVERGAARPYWLADKGMTPDGVLTRANAASVPTPIDEIDAIVRETNGENYEDFRSFVQALSFNKASAVFAQHKLSFDAVRFQQLGLVDGSGAYTNLALLLSDQCPSTIKATVFQDASDSVVVERANFAGSLLQQIDDVYAYVDQYNRKYAKVQGARYVDDREYRGFPEQAIREAIFNAVAHRDYDSKTQTLIRIYSDRLEIVSVGGLTRDVAPEELELGVSVSRNPKLFAILADLQLVSACGVGLDRIRDAYDQYGEEPEMEIAKNFFKATLPNAYASVVVSEPVPTVAAPVVAGPEKVRVARFSPFKFSTTPNVSNAVVAGDSMSVTSTNLTSPTATLRRGYYDEQDGRVLALFQLRPNAALTCREVEQKTGLTTDAALDSLRRLVAADRLVVGGSGANLWYRLA